MAFVIVVVGGLGSFSGALVGGILIGIVQSVMSTLWPEGARLMIYVAMAAVLLLRPMACWAAKDDPHDQAFPPFPRTGHRHRHAAVHALGFAGQRGADLRPRRHGCNLLLGYTGLLSFGQGHLLWPGRHHRLAAHALAPAPCRWRCWRPWPWGAMGAAVVGWIAIRQRGTYFVMLTLAFAQMFYFLACSRGLTGGDNGLLDIPAPVARRRGQTLWRWSRPGSTTVRGRAVPAGVLAAAPRLRFDVRPHAAGRARQRGAMPPPGYDLRPAEAAGLRDLRCVTGLAGPCTP